MAFGSANTLGTALNTNANQTSLAITTSAAAEAGNLVVLAVACDNTITGDGDSTQVSGVTDSAGGNLWTRAKGFSNGQGAAQAGADISIWYSLLKNQINNGGTITASFTSATDVDAAAMSAWEFTVAAGSGVLVEGTPGGLANDAANAGSLTVTTRNIECLRFRAIASESNSATALVQTTNWTLISQAVSGAGTSATEMGVRGEFRISTTTSDASAPTGGAGAVDHASAYVAFAEFPLLKYGWEVQPWQPPIAQYMRKHTGPLSATTRGPDPPTLERGFEAIYPQPPHPKAQYQAAALAGSVNRDEPFVPTVAQALTDWAWEQTDALTRPAAAVGQRFAAMVGPANIPSVFSQWINDGWKVQPPQPPRQPAAKQAAGQFPAAINIDVPYTQWVNAGWEPDQPTALPRDPTVRSMGAQLQAAANVEVVYQNWYNSGWGPTLPTPLVHPPATRLFGGDLPAAINIEAVYSQWLNAGWEVQPPPPPHQPASKQAGSLLLAALNIDPPYTQWVNAGWSPTLPVPLSHLPATRQDAAALPAAANIETIYLQWINAGWAIQPPQPPHQPAPRQNAGQFPAPFNIEAVFVPWINAGWDPDLPQPLIRRPLIRQGAAALPDAANIPNIFQDWRNLGWGAQPPQPPAFRRYHALPEFIWRYDAAPPPTGNWGFDPFPIQPKYRQRYIGPVRLPASGPAPPTLEWGFQPNNPQPPTAARVSGVLNAWRNNEDVYVFTGGVTFGWDPPPFAPPLRTPCGLAGAVGPLNVPSPYVQWVNTGWEPDQPSSLPRDPAIRFLAGQLPGPLNIESPYVQWVNAGWPVQPPQPPHQPTTKQAAAKLPGAINIDPPYTQWVNSGWQATLPVPLTVDPATRQAAASLPAPANIEIIYVNWINAGWAPTLPAQLPHPPASRLFAGQLPGPTNVEAVYSQWVNDGWKVQPPQPPHRLFFGHIPAAANVEIVFQNWQNAGWTPTLPTPLAHPPASRQAAAALPAAANIEFVYQPWTNVPWQIEPSLLPTRRPERGGAALPSAGNIDSPFAPFTPYGWPAEQPRLPHPRPERVGAVLRGDDGIAGQFSYFLGYGWEVPSPQPPHTRWERAAASLPAATNIETRFEAWVNSGWLPVLPTLPAFRRLFAMPELSWRADQIAPVPYEWGFQPTVPEGLRAWFNRAAAVMPGANVEAPLFGFLPAGWQQIGGWGPPAYRRYLPPSTAVVRGFSPDDLFVVPYEWGFEPTLHNLPRRRWERSAASLPAQLNLPDVYVFVQADLPPWVAQVPLILARPRLFLGGIASKSQFGSPDFFPLYGWENQSPQPPMPGWRRTAGVMPGANIDYVFQNWRNAGWAATLPNPLAHPPAASRRAAGTAGAANVDAPLFPFIAYGWPTELPRMPHPRPERAGSILRGDDGTAAKFDRFLPYVWDAQPVQPPRRRHERAGAIQTKDDGVEAAFQAWVNRGWEIPSPQPPRRLWEKSAGKLPAAANIDVRFENWVNAGWLPVLPTLPAFRRYFPTPGANIDSPFVNWINDGWEATLPILTRDPAIRLMESALPAAFNIDVRFENWVNAGWTPALPTLPAFRRIFAMPEFTGRLDTDAAAVVLVSYEWGFQPLTPEGLRTWFNRAAGIMPVANIEAAFVNWINAGWAANLPLPLTRDPTIRLAAAGLLTPPGNIDTPFLPWVNAGWEATLPLLTVDPARYLRAGQLPAAFNIDPVLVQSFLLYGWEVLAPHLRHPRPEAAGAILVGDAGIADRYNQWRNLGWGLQPFQPPHAHLDKTIAGIMLGANIEAKYEQWRNLGWGAQPFQPPRRPWEKNAAAIMRGANIEAKYEQWRNQGWTPTLPILRIVRPAIDLGDFTWRTDTFGPVAHEWGFVPITPDALRNWFTRAAAIEAIHRPADEFIFVQGVTTEFLQTYFISNMARFMNRRG